MRTRNTILVAAAALAVTLAACASASPDTAATGEAEAAGEAAPTGADPAGTVEISIAQFRFEPREITIPVGTTVRWRNDESGIPHDTTANDTTWESETLQPGDEFEFTFTEPGTYTYLCTIHPSMTATVVVEG